MCSHERAPYLIDCPNAWPWVHRGCLCGIRCGCMAQFPTLPRAIVLDAAGPWHGSNCLIGATSFTGLLKDAGYQVDTLSPVDLPSAKLTPEVLLAAPSPESLPSCTFKAPAAFVAAGGTLMPSGGVPFRSPPVSQRRRKVAGPQNIPPGPESTESASWNCSMDGGSLRPWRICDSRPV